MKRLYPVLAAGLLASFSSPAAILYYDLTATGENGTTGTGSFSFDDSLIGADDQNIFADGIFQSFSVTLQVVGGTPSTTTFDLSTVNGSVFVLARTAGEITDFNPGGSNGDGYSLNPNPINMALLTGNSVSEMIHWSYTAAVPEPETYAATAGLALGAFALIRRARRPRRTA